VLEDIHYYGSINSLDTLTYLVNKLPLNMWKSLVKEAMCPKFSKTSVADRSKFVKSKVISSFTVKAK